eukprot:PhF_6_TR5577/c0_g1_i1/m.7983/K08857/NEK1_4_5; NIMA (never in mitosis gene a)-related kinase 1/4/5
MDHVQSGGDFMRRALLDVVIHPIRLMGKGATAEVWMVRCDTPEAFGNFKTFVVKMMDVTVATKHAIGEVNILRSLHHPNIVQYLDSWVDTSNSKHCIATELCDGGDLAVHLSRHNRPSETELREYMSQLIGALMYVHSNHIVHRDIKLSNIFISADAKILRLGDFGVSRQVAMTDELMHTLMGTPYYMSPEIAQQKPYTAKTDMWSLGVVMYELMTKQRPFTGRNVPDLYRNIVQMPVPTFTSVATGKYSKELLSMCSGMLDKDPSRRFSAKDMTTRFPWLIPRSTSPTPLNVGMGSPASHQSQDRPSPPHPTAPENHHASPPSRPGQQQWWETCQAGFTINVRSRPSMSAPIVARVEPGNHVLEIDRVTIREGNSIHEWMKIQAGWVLVALGKQPLWKKIRVDAPPSPPHDAGINVHVPPLQGAPPPQVPRSTSPSAVGRLPSVRSVSPPFPISPVKKIHFNPTSNPIVPAQRVSPVRATPRVVTFRQGLGPQSKKDDNNIIGQGRIPTPPRVSWDALQQPSRQLTPPRQLPHVSVVEPIKSQEQHTAPSSSPAHPIGSVGKERMDCVLEVLEEWRRQQGNEPVAKVIEHIALKLCHDDVELLAQVKQYSSAKSVLNG